ncbi:hypothetical protein ACFWBR_27385 [Streptomyces sp. NPDC060006]|uniref:hypothetical protein n=1 Tax=unclassified Streptomyces TaxID=2593676 RepID=UPI0036CA84BE
MRLAQTYPSQTTKSLRQTSATTDEWARNRDQRFALFLAKRLAEAEVLGCCLAELKALAGVQDVFAEWLAQHDLATEDTDNPFLNQVSTLNWALRSVAHSIWASHPEWELSFHPAAAKPPIDPLKALLGR